MNVRAKITALTRLRNSRNGNPRFALQLRPVLRDDKGLHIGLGEPIECTTKPDASLSYEITAGWLGSYVEASVQYTRRGAVYLVNVL